METFDEMSSKFKDFIELKQFSEAQHNTIVSLSKKINNLEKENEHLKTLLESSTQLTTQDKSPMIVDLGISNEEVIAATELRKIKESCVNQQSELTLEQAKKVELYTKILSNLKNKNKGKDGIEKLDDNTLLSVIKDESN